MEWFKRDIDEFIERFYCEPKEPPGIAMEKRGKPILFFPDFDQPYPVWPKVIKEYVDRFSGKDDVTLILRIAHDENFKTRTDNISQVLTGKSNSPDILILCDFVKDERSYFKEVKYFITTRSLDTVRYVEYAEEFNVKILSGIDIPVFD